MSSVHNLPTFPVKFNQLPSRGLGYPEGLNIFYRGYTAGEMSKIAAVREDNITYDYLLKFALEGITVDGVKFDKMKLSFIDVLALGLRRRVSSEGELKFKLPYECEKCNQVNTLVFDHTHIKFDTISEHIEIEGEKHEVKLPINVQIKGKDLAISYPTVGDVLAAYARKGVDRVTAIKASCVTNMDFKEAYELLYNLNEATDFDDLEVLEVVDKALYHNIAPVKAVCSQKVEREGGQLVQCGHTNEVSIEGKELLIRPFRESKAVIGNKIRFGDKQHS